MGIAKAPAKILLLEARRRPLEGRVLTLGRQDIWVSHKMLREMSAEVGAPLRDAASISLSDKPAFAAQGLLSDRSFFQLLGFSNVESMDYSDYEGADHIVDLNNARMPDNFIGMFDFIVDGGTIEHVFHLPNVLNNIFSMLRVGGRILHLAPSSNHIDHGFYMFSPTLFMDFYTANKFEVNLSQVFRYTQRHDVDPWEASDYEPGCLEPVSFGGLDDSLYGVIFMATKTIDSTGNTVPQQGSAGRAMPEQPLNPGNPASVKRRLRQKLSLIPGASFMWRVARRIPGMRTPVKKGLGLPIKIRY